MTTRRLALFLLSFIVLEILLVDFVDRPLSEYLRSVDEQHHDLIDFFRFYTDLGKSKWYLWVFGAGIIMCAGLLRLKSFIPVVRIKIQKIGDGLLFLFVGVAISGIITDIIKPLIGRARPVELQREGLYGFHPLTFHTVWNSTPSGHSTTAFALAAGLILLLPRGRWLWISYALALGLSRIMVNAHFLSDVFAGALVGILTMLFFRQLLNQNGIFHLRRCIFPIDR